MSTRYAVVQAGGSVFGVGRTPDEAILDASKWIDEPVSTIPWRPEEDGDLYLTEATERYYEAWMAGRIDGDSPYALDGDGRLDTAERPPDA